MTFLEAAAQRFDAFFVTAVYYAWGPPLILLLLGGGAFLTIYSRFLPFFALRHAVDVLRGKYDNPDDPGEISHLQALSTALAATVGVSNIGLVPVAIALGGPGAIFWMWMAAIVGMATKFFTCTLACMYRKVDEEGVAQGGPMYYIELGLGRKFRPMAIFFACCGLVGCLCLTQSNQCAEVLEVNHGVNRYVTAILIVVGVGAVVLGGIHRIARISEMLVPGMCLVYVLASLSILVMRAPVIPGVLWDIVSDAFTGSAAAAGAMIAVIQVGVKRAAFSNEAGIGTAPMAHGAAKTAEPVREGLVAMLGPCIDTLIVCTMTALVILTSGPDVVLSTEANTLEGAAITSRAFEAALGPVGAYLISLSVVLFAISTMFGYSYYGRKCLAYLIGQRRGHYYNVVYIASLAVGAVWSITSVINVLDTAFALMAFPNMIATLLLAPSVMRAARDYLQRYRIR